MNKASRKQIADAITALEALENLQAETQSQIDNICSPLRDLGESEQEKFDNLPEGLQAGENGQAIETAAQAISEAVYSLDNGEISAALDSLRELSE